MTKKDKLWQKALTELQTAWEMVKEDFIAKGLNIPIAPRKHEYSKV